MTVLASRTVFLPEVDASSLRLTCREVWPVETSQTHPGPRNHAETDSSCSVHQETQGGQVMMDTH